VTADEAAFLAQLPTWAFGFVLVLARAGSACMLLPGIGEVQLPATIRAGFAATLTFVLLPVLAPSLPPVPDDVARALAMLAAEIVTGLWFGWLVRLLLMAMPICGQIVSSVLGQTNVLQPDPALGPQTAALAQLFALATVVLVLRTGLHTLPFAALAGTYDVIPAGKLLPAADTADQVTRALADAFALALRLASPFVLASLVWQTGLGVLTRLVPQLHVFFAAMPGQILAGILLLALLAGGMFAAVQEHLQASFLALPGL
jgi:flagellar biosynthetic protein FliR